MENWSQYNEKLVRRGEIIMSFDVIENWHKELEVMNHNKRGRKFDYPFIYEIARICQSVFWITVQTN